MTSENTNGNGKETRDRTAPKKAAPKPAVSTDVSEVHSVRVDSAAAPRVAPPKAWNSRKPPGGKLSAKAEPPQDSKSA